MFLRLGVVGRALGQEPAIPRVLEELIDDSPVTYRKELIEIYGDRQYEPLWISPSDFLNAEGQALNKILSEAEQLWVT